MSARMCVGPADCGKTMTIGARRQNGDDKR
jgi:hypothetical protein